MRMPTQTGSQLVERTDPFVVELDRFQGPLDLLLHLIRCQDIDIFDIPIAQITGQFIAVVHEAEERFSLERAGDFLEMAATLVRIKAQLLLPRRDELLDEDPRSELVRRLLEYEQFREVAYGLAEAESDRALCFAKGYVTPRVLPELAVQPLERRYSDRSDHRPIHRRRTRSGETVLVGTCWRVPGDGGDTGSYQGSSAAPAPR